MTSESGARPEVAEAPGDEASAISFRHFQADPKPLPSRPTSPRSPSRSPPRRHPHRRPGSAARQPRDRPHQRLGLVLLEPVDAVADLRRDGRVQVLPALERHTGASSPATRRQRPSRTLGSVALLLTPGGGRPRWLVDTARRACMRQQDARHARDAVDAAWRRSPSAPQRRGRGRFRKPC